MATHSNESVDFSLQLEDYSKLLVLVKEVLAPAPAEYHCDIFSQPDCHHLTQHGLTTSKTDKCSFCRFTDLLRDKYSHVDVIQAGYNIITRGLSL